MKTGWIVTKDFCDTPFDSKTFKPVAVIGPRGCDLTLEELLNGHPFKMYDDDKVLYYEGFLVGDKNSEEGFMPLDHYGTPNAGAVHIEYYNDETKKWEGL